MVSKYVGSAAVHRWLKHEYFNSDSAAYRICFWLQSRLAMAEERDTNTVNIPISWYPQNTYRPTIMGHFGTKTGRIPI